MVGHGGPSTARISFAPRVGIILFALLLAALGATPRALLAADSTMRLRIAWGGGAERVWHGGIALSQGTLKLIRPLGTLPDSPGSIWNDGEQRIEIRERSPRAYDGIDVEVTAPSDARLSINLTADADPRPFTAEVPLADLVTKIYRRTLDDRDSQSNQLLIRRAPGDVLRVATDRDPLIFTPGEVWKVTVEPHLLPTTAGATVYIKTRLVGARGGTEVWSQEHTIKIPAADAPTPTVPLEIKLPDQEGVFDLVVEASERGPLRWPKPLAERRVQLLVLADHAAPAPIESAAVGWTQVMEIDPANPHWYERFKSLPKIPGILPNGSGGLWSGPPGNGPPQTIQHPLGRLVQLMPATAGADPSWQAYPLSVSKVGMPHVVEIDYPADLPQTLGISVVEPNAAGEVGPIGLDSGVYIPDSLAAGAPRWARHRLMFWPHTSSPLLLLTNRRDGGRAAYGKIRVFAGPARLPRAFPASDPRPERLLAGYYDRPLFAPNFGGGELLDPVSGHSLTDWQTFFEGGTRLADYLNSVGYNGLMLAVFSEGSTIYPSKLLDPTPRFDTGAFFDQGQDLQRKDVLEMLLRLFDRENLKLIPALQFSTPLPELEAMLRAGGSESIGIQPVGADGLPWTEANPTRHGLAPYYNLLDERVQQAMLAVVHELMARYGNHSSLAGLAVELSADGYGQLPGEAWGLDDRTIARFARETQQPVPGEGPSRFTQRAQFVTGAGRREWLQWRSQVLADFHRRIRRELAATRPDIRLYLTPTNMLDLPELERDLRPGLPSRGSIADAMAAVGIQSESYREEAGISLLRPQRILPPGPLAPQAIAIEMNRSAEWDELAHAGGSPASLCYHEPQKTRLASFDKVNPLGREKSFAWLVSEFAPSQETNRQRFIHSLARLDSQAQFDGGWLLPLGQEKSLAELVAVYRRLPAARFETVADCPQPVTIRTLVDQRRTYAYLVNDSAWNVRVQLQVDAPAGCRPEELAGQHPITLNGTTWTVDLAPYDLAAVSFPSKEVRLSAPQVTMDPSLRPVLEAAIRDLRNRRNVLGSPMPLPGLNNDGFEAAPRGGLIPGWSVTGAGQATLDSHDPHIGHQSLRLTGAGTTVVLRGEPFPVSQTGRLAVSVWMRVQDTAAQPRLRLALEGPPEGRQFYRGASLGQGDGVVPIPAQWNQFIFAIDDIPPEGLTSLRFRIDINGPGDVWIDDVQLFDLVFNESEKIQLNKIISLAEFQLNAGQLGDCLHELEGYWPRLLAAQVPLAPAPVVNTPPAAPPVKDPPDKSANKPGVVDRFKELWKF